MIKRMRPTPEHVERGQYWDSTFSPYIGCTPCSPGCDNCWARRQEDGRLRHLNRMQVQPFVVRDGLCLERCQMTSAEIKNALVLVDPYFHRGPVFQGERVLGKAAKMKGVVFAGFRSDLFHADIPNGSGDALYAMLSNWRATWLVLTKRARNMERDIRGATARMWSHIRFGVSVCNQIEADEKLPHLKALAERGLFTWASVEPMLGPIDLSKHLPYLKWVVCGGETGKCARPMDPDWARAVRDQCKAAGVPVWIKQMSKKGEIPADLMVRQWDESDLK